MARTKSTKETQTERINGLAKEYKTECTRARRNKIFMEVEWRCGGYLRARIAGKGKYECDSILSLFHLELIDCLTRWEGRSNFQTYFFYRLKAILRKYYSEEKPLVKAHDTASIEQEAMEEVGTVEGTYDFVETVQQGGYVIKGNNYSPWDQQITRL